MQSTAIKLSPNPLKNRLLTVGMLAASMLLASATASAWSGDQRRYEHRSHAYSHHQHVKQKLKHKLQHKRYQAAQRRAAYHSWRRGDYLPVAYSPRYVVRDWRSHRLSAPPRGHEWLRINGRFVQVSIGDHRISRLW